MRAEPALQGTRAVLTGTLQAGCAVGVTTAEDVRDCETSRREGLAAGGAVQEGRAGLLPAVQLTQTERML